MSLLETITELMRRDTAALGFIPNTVIQERWINRNLVIPIQPKRASARGYLLFGPPKPGRPLFINQVCVDRDYRLAYHASRAVHELIKIANIEECTEIVLRCAADLPANAFWRAIGFELIGQVPGGRARHRLINRYRLVLRPHQRLVESAPPRSFPWWVSPASRPG